VAAQPPAGTGGQSGLCTPRTGEARECCTMGGATINRPGRGGRHGSVCMGGTSRGGNRISSGFSLEERAPDTAV